MSYEQFHCDRKMIESLPSVIQQNLLIQQYCASEFLYVNMVDLFYRVYKSNAILTLLLNMICFLLFLNIFPPIIYRMLCPSVLSTIKSLKLKHVFASLTVTVVINLLPDLYTFSQQDIYENAINLRQVITVLGEVIIVLNLAIGITILINGQSIVVSKTIFLKESVFILISVGIIIIFGVMGTISYMTVSLLFVNFCLYYGVSFLIELKRKDWDNFEALESEETEILTEVNYDMPVQPPARHQPVLPDKDRLNEEDDESEDEADDSETAQRKLDMQKFYNEILDEVTFPESGFVMNCVLVPPMILALVSIPYYRNPLMKTLAKYLVSFLASAVILFNFKLGDMSLGYRFLISLLVALVFLAMNLMAVNKQVLQYSYEFLGYLSAISYSHILLLLFMDSLSFLGFYFSGNSSIVYDYWPATISGSFMLFTAIGYSKGGKALMGIYSCYSSINVLMSLFMGTVLMASVSKNVRAFPLFTFIEGETSYSSLHYLAWIMLAMLLVNVLLQTAFVFANSFRLHMGYALSTVLSFGLPFIALTSLGFIFGNNQFN